MPKLLKMKDKADNFVTKKDKIFNVGFRLVLVGSSGSGNTRGSGMADTILNGSGNYQQRFVNADDYRAQEFPDGTPTTINTYYLRLIKA